MRKSIPLISLCAILVTQRSLYTILEHNDNFAEEIIFVKTVEHSRVENNLEAFEKKIAYFFGVKNEQPVIEAYLNALQKLNNIGVGSVELLEHEMIPYLEKAYLSIAQQRNWEFDIHTAAKLEFQIILGNVNGSSFEDVQDLMMQLYTVVFRSDSPFIKKAAMLRTFLYQYKASLLENQQTLSELDQIIMFEMAQTSMEYLNAID